MPTDKLIRDVASKVERIHTCREEELSLYRQLLELSRAQRKAIMEGNTDSIVWATKEKGRLIERIEAIDMRISGLLDDISVDTANGMHPHLCQHEELDVSSGCPLNANIAQVMKEILEAELENQALLEEAITAVGNEIEHIDSGDKAVKAYWGHASGVPTGHVDDTL